jgi:hypothetical protein
MTTLLAEESMKNLSLALRRPAVVLLAVGSCWTSRRPPGHVVPGILGQGAAAANEEEHHCPQLK